MCGTYKLCLFSALAGLFFFPEGIKDSFKEESWGHEKCVRSLPYSGDRCKVLASFWPVTFLSFLVLSLRLPPPYTKANTIDFCIKSLQKISFPWVSTIIQTSSALVAHVVEMCVFVILSIQSLGTAPGYFPELWRQLRQASWNSSLWQPSLFW